MRGGVGLAVAASIEAMPGGFLDEAGTGQAPRSLASAASLWMRSGLSPTTSSSSAAQSSPTPNRLVNAGAARSVRVARMRSRTACAACARTVPASGRTASSCTCTTWSASARRRCASSRPAMILEDELGVPPSRRTVAFDDQIRLEQLDVSLQVPAGPAPVPAESVETVGGLLEHLRQVRSALADVERQVAQDIQSIEVVLPSRAAVPRGAYFDLGDISIDPCAGSMRRRS